MTRKTAAPLMCRASNTASKTPTVVSMARPKPTKMYVFLTKTLRLVGPDETKIPSKMAL